MSLFFILFFVPAVLSQPEFDHPKWIEDHYGILFDLTVFPRDLSSSDLIVSVMDISKVLGIKIDGVKIEDNFNLKDSAKIVCPARVGDKEGMEDRYVLIVSLDVASDPRRIFPLLQGGEEKMLAEQKRQEIETERRETLGAVLGEGSVWEEEKNDLSANLVTASGKLIDKVGGIMEDKQAQDRKTEIEAKIENYYLTFD